MYAVCGRDLFTAQWTLFHFYSSPSNQYYIRLAFIESKELVGQNFTAQFWTKDSRQKNSKKIADLILESVNRNLLGKKLAKFFSEFLQQAKNQKLFL
jgi:thiamine kinase-like enzyme